MAKEEYYKCDKCDEGTMVGDFSFQYDSFPPQYDFSCDNCDNHKVTFTFEDWESFKG